MLPRWLSVEAITTNAMQILWYGLFSRNVSYNIVFICKFLTITTNVMESLTGTTILITRLGVYPTFMAIQIPVLLKCFMHDGYFIFYNWILWPPQYTGLDYVGTQRAPRAGQDKLIPPERIISPFGVGFLFPVLFCPWTWYFVIVILISIISYWLWCC